MSDREGSMLMEVPKGSVLPEKTPAPGPSCLALDNEELVRQALGGSQAAFTELSSRFRPRLIALLSRQLAHADAEDIAQETLAKAFSQLDRFDERYRFSTWLYTIALRLTIDHRRARSRWNRWLSRNQNEPRVTRSSSEQLEVIEEAGQIWRLARRVLAEPQYSAMWLRYAEDLSVGEIGQIMGKSALSVRVLLHRARQILLKESQIQEEGFHAQTYSQAEARQ